MFIKEIKIQNFRGIKELKIENIGPINILIGRNNSCKTAILEAICAFLTHNNLSGNSMDIRQPYAHISDSGKIFKDVSMEFLFDYPNFEESTQKKGDIALLKKNFKNGVLLLRKQFDEASKSTQLENIYQIKNIEKLQSLKPTLVEEFKISFFKNFRNQFNNNKTQFIGSIDGYRGRTFNMKDYFELLDGLNAKPVDIRGGLRDSLNNLKQIHSGDQAFITKEVMDYLNNKSLFDFHKLTDRTIVRGGIMEFGKRGSGPTGSLHWFNQGQGELDQNDLILGLRGTNEHPKKLELILIDEPEKHKHPGAQRIFLSFLVDEYINKTKKPKTNTQIFIATHSLVFASKYWDDNFRVFLITKSKKPRTRVIENSAKQLVQKDNTNDVMSAIGAIHADMFFDKAVWFVEGLTELVTIRAILKYNYTDELSLGIKIQNEMGASGLNKNLKGTFSLMNDLSLLPILFFDNEHHSERNITDLMRQYPDLFSKPKIQKNIFKPNFINSLPEDLVKKAIVEMCKEKKIPKAKYDLILTAALAAKNNSKSVEKELEKELHKLELGYDFSKRDFAEEIASIILKDAENQRIFATDPIFKKIEETISFIKSL